MDPITPPRTDIDWNNLDLQVKNVNGHVESRFDNTTRKWSKPEFVGSPLVPIHLLSPALNYGQQAYEGLRAFRSPQGHINIFRPEKHSERLSFSAATVSIPEIPKTIFMEAIKLAVLLNAEYIPPHQSNAMLYIRPVVFGSGPQIALVPSEEYVFCVTVQPGTPYHGLLPLDAIVSEELDRAAPVGVGAAKIGGNYAPGIRHCLDAYRKGYPMVLFLDGKTRTKVEEFSTSAFLGIKEKDTSYVLVASNSKNVVNSITVDSCIQLAKSLGWKVERREIEMEELPQFDEVIAAGTAVGLVPIRSITSKAIGAVFSYQKPGDQGRPGPATSLLSKLLMEIQKGILPDEYGWCSKV